MIASTAIVIVIALLLQGLVQAAPAHSTSTAKAAVASATHTGPHRSIALGEKCNSTDWLPCKKNLACHYGHCVPNVLVAGEGCGPWSNETRNSRIDPVCSNDQGLLCVDPTTAEELAFPDDDKMTMMLTTTKHGHHGHAPMPTTGTIMIMPPARRVGICAAIFHKPGHPCGLSLTPPSVCGYHYQCIISNVTDNSGHCVKVSYEGGDCGGFRQYAPVCADGYTCVLNMSVADLPGKCHKEKHTTTM